MADTAQHDTHPKQELAEERTDWAHERTLLAKERTFSAWIRTGIGAVAAGLAAAQLLAVSELRWLIQTLSAVCIGVGVLIFLLAFWRYRSTFKRLAHDEAAGVPLPVIAVVTGALCLAAAISLLLVFQA